MERAKYEDGMGNEDKAHEGALRARRLIGDLLSRREVDDYEAYLLYAMANAHEVHGNTPYPVVNAHRELHGLYG